MRPFQLRATVALAALGLAAAALAQGNAPAHPPAQPAKSAPNLPPSAAGRAADAAQIDSDVQVPIDQTPMSGTSVDSDVEVPIDQTPAKVPAMPPNAGFNNSGGMVDGAALSQQATGGVHYHYHYYGPGSVSPSGIPGYAQARYVNPASVAGGGNRFLTAPIGPGNPAPMNTLAGEYQNSVNPAVWRGPAPNPELAGGGMGGGVGGQAWSYGGEVGDWNPYALGGNGYIAGFND